MSRYLQRLKALKSEMLSQEQLTKPTKPPFVSFDNTHDSCVSENSIIFPIVNTSEINSKGGTRDKGDVLDFPSEWLKRFDEKTLERLSIMTVDGGLSDEEAQMAIVEPETDMKSSWPSENYVLIDWFVHLEPPTDPFFLEPHIYVVNPVQFFSSLRMDIKTGPKGPRGIHTGALIHDLINLKNVMDYKHAYGEYFRIP